MTIEELRHVIEDLPDNMEIILSTDAEGNVYSPLDSVSADCIYVPENIYGGEVYDTLESAENNCLLDEEWEEIKKVYRKCLVLYSI